MVAPFSCFLWDVDGTILDTASLIAETQNYAFLKYFGRTLSPEENRALNGLPVKQLIRHFGPLESFGVDEEEIIRDIVTYYRANNHRETPLEEVIMLVREGKRRAIPTAVVTSKKREELNDTLERLRLSPYLDCQITSDDVTRGKPDPEGIFQALAHLAIPTDQLAHVVFIGDTVYDMQAAHAAGIKAIAVTWGAASKEALLAEEPAYLCQTPADLRRVLFDGL